MTKKTTIGAFVALAVLVAASFTIVLQAHAQTPATDCHFATNLGTGSTGSDVLMLQKFLNESPDTRLAASGAGSPGMETAYYGSVTANAVSRFQVKYRADILVPAGLTTPTGYFGNSSRAKANELCAGDDGDDEDDNDDEEDSGPSDDGDDAADAIDSARDNLEDARQEFEEADDANDPVGNAEDLLDEAEDVLEDADDSFDDEEYDDAIEFAEEAEDLIDEALDEMDSDDEDDVSEESSVDTSAEVNDRNGSDNDTATFSIEFTLTAFNQDAYFDEDASVSVNYEIQDSEGNDVSGATGLSAILQSSADEEGGYFHVEEDEGEEFTLTVTFDPLAADEGEFYRLQLVSMEFNDSEAAPDQTWTASPAKKFRTDYVHIDD